VTAFFVTTVRYCHSIGSNSLPSPRDTAGRMADRKVLETFRSSRTDAKRRVKSILKEFPPERYLTHIVSRKDGTEAVEVGMERRLSPVETADELADYGD
jgi:hypothetical protein